MTRTIQIDKNERGLIRVFAINQPVADVKDALKKLPKADLARQLLDSPHLDTTSTEIFPLSDLTGMGLSVYLNDGYAVDEAGLAADQTKLDALDGFVMLLFSESFKGMEAVLTPSPAVTLIGTYAEYSPPGGGAAIDTDSARPYSGSPGMTPPTPARGPAGSAMVVAALIVLTGLGIWWLLT